MAVLTWVVLVLELGFEAFTRWREGRRWHRANLGTRHGNPVPTIIIVAEHEPAILIVAGHRNGPPSQKLGTASLLSKDSPRTRGHRSQVMHKMRAKALADLERTADKLDISAPKS
jgi:hypothetical protein